jgi:hypothetical protein
MEKKWKRALSKEELAGLLCVPTTVAQAKLILKRNMGMLRALETGREYHGKVGCPHCGHNNCEKCAWAKHPGEKPYGYGACCMGVSFGGVEGRSVQDMSISYSFDEEHVFSADVIRDVGLCAGLYSMTLRFLRGHIEWSNEVIRRGGVK